MGDCEEALTFGPLVVQRGQRSWPLDRQSRHGGHTPAMSDKGLLSTFFGLVDQIRRKQFEPLHGVEKSRGPTRHRFVPK